MLRAILHHITMAERWAHPPTHTYPDTMAMPSVHSSHRRSRMPLGVELRFTVPGVKHRFLYVPSVLEYVPTEFVVGRTSLVLLGDVFPVTIQRSIVG